MSRRASNFRSLESQFLRVYSAWQETHRMEYAAQWTRLLGILLRRKPHYSVRRPFAQAF